MRIFCKLSMVSVSYTRWDQQHEELFQRVSLKIIKINWIWLWGKQMHALIVFLEMKHIWPFDVFDIFCLYLFKRPWKVWNDWINNQRMTLCVILHFFVLIVSGNGELVRTLDFGGVFVFNFLLWFMVRWKKYLIIKNLENVKNSNRQVSERTWKFSGSQFESHLQNIN